LARAGVSQARAQHGAEGIVCVWREKEEEEEVGWSIVWLLFSPKFNLVVVVCARERVN
jgi:hypothetical protein